MRDQSREMKKIVLIHISRDYLGSRKYFCDAPGIEKDRIFTIPCAGKHTARMDCSVP